MVKISVLVDNNSIIDRYYRSEPALSLWIEAAGSPVLLDTGYSGAFLENALKMHKDPAALSHVVLSHGHFDHTWGLSELVRYFTEGTIEDQLENRPQVVAHPQCFDSKIVTDIGSIGSMFSRETLERFFPVIETREPFWLDG